MLIDSHLHLPHGKYEKPLDQVIADAQKAGIDKFIAIGTDKKDNERLIKVCEDFDSVFGTIGIYPHENKEMSLEELEKLVQTQIKMSSKIIGIGECGIDITGFDAGRNVPDQIALFEMQLNLCVDKKLPVVVHNRNGDLQVLDLLGRYTKRGLTGVIHCFDSDWEFAKKVLDMGFYISFSGLVTYPNKPALVEVTKKVPSDRFLVETDAPYLPPQGHRGEVNYPEYVKITAQRVSDIRNETFEKVCEDTVRNTKSLFGLQYKD